MTRVSHTPRPWKRVGPSGLSGDICVVADNAGEYLIAKVNKEPDAQLIEAAPDMLEALRQVARIPEIHRSGLRQETMRAIEAMRAAIAKAEGRAE